MPESAPTAASSAGAASDVFSSGAVSVERGRVSGLQDVIVTAIQDAFMIFKGKPRLTGVTWGEKIIASLRNELNEFISALYPDDATFMRECTRSLQLFYTDMNGIVRQVEQESFAAVGNNTALVVDHMKNRIITWRGETNAGTAVIKQDFLQTIQSCITKLDNNLAENIARAQERKMLADRAHTERLTGVVDASRELGKITAFREIKEGEESRKLSRTLAVENNRIAAAKWLLVASGITALAGMGGYLGLKHYFKERPKIIRPQDTSISFGLKKAKYPRSRIDKLILPPALQKSVMQKFQGMEFAITQRLPLSNMLFYGPPGVGKSLAAQEFVRSLSDKNLAHHIIIRGPAFQQFKRSGEAVREIRAIFEAAEISYKKTKKPTVIDFEEAEILFADRGNSAISTEMSRSILNTVLGLINESVAHHIALMFTTNRKDDLDSAILDRVHISNQILFDVPEQKERETFLRQYLNDVLLEQGFEVSPDVFDAVPELARSITGLSGRQISGMITQVIYPLLNSGQVELTLPLFKEIIADTMAKKASL